MTNAVWLRSRLLHLVLLALFWIVLARFMLFAQDGIHYGPKELLGDLLLGAAWGHLWFLPALCIITLGSWAALRFRLRKVTLALGGLAALAFLAAMPMLSDRGADYLYRTPLFWFVFFWLGIHWSSLKVKMWSAVTPGLALLIGAGWVPPAYQRSVLLAGAALVALAVAEWALVPAPRSVLGKRLAGTSLGIYLIHPFVLAGLRHSLPGLVDWAVLLWFATAAISLGLVVLLLRLPALRSLVS